MLKLPQVGTVEARLGMLEEKVNEIVDWTNTQERLIRDIALIFDRIAAAYARKHVSDSIKREGG